MSPVVYSRAHKGTTSREIEMNEQLTPAQRVGIDGIKVKAVVGRYNAIRLTATMVNALAGVGGIKCNWKRPPSPAYTVLERHFRLIKWERLEDGSGRWILTERGTAWLRAEGLIPE